MRLKLFLNRTGNFTEISSDIKDILLKDCKYFLKEVKKSNGLLYRGKEDHIESIELFKNRIADRKPKDTQKHIHDEFNLLFKKKFGWPVRNGIFVTSDKGLAEEYGHPNIFFPKGDFDFVWSDSIKDLYSDEIENSIIGIEFYNVYDGYEWEEEFGEGGNGNWTYKGKKISYNKYSDNILDILGIDEEDYDEADLEWVPDVEEEEWYIKSEGEFSNRVKELYKSIVNRYTNKNLLKAMKSKNEISFNCKEYYLINVMYEESILKWIKEI